MHAAAVDHAFQGGDIAVIAAPGQGQMAFSDLGSIGWIKVAG